MVGKPEVTEIGICGSVPGSRLVGSDRDSSRFTGHSEVMFQVQITQEQVELLSFYLLKRLMNIFGKRHGEAVL